MRMLRLVPAFLLCLIVGGQVMFLPGQAYARCCMCGMCNPAMCTCPGVGSCPWCARPDSQSLQSNAPTDNDRVDIRSVQAREPFRVASPDVIQGFVELKSESRTRGNFALNFIDNFKSGLKFGCPGF